MFSKCEERKVPSEVRAEPRSTMRNVTRCAIEEWIWENGRRERGGLLRCCMVERRPAPLLFLTMNKIHENRWLLQMIRTTPFDGQLMICGPENYIAFWVPIDPTSVDRSSEGAPSTEGTSLSAPASATDPIPDSRISIRLENLLGAVIGRGRTI
ncbi:hypothetical protein BpHYR1_030845 [Brachionus plicatilis]|uniref:Uncharacterized protein n=1 Tax=Brachionus plicatilis TaxID=10195 RepID=A0A3M7Q2X5_BRAPC|nr:hypothetical protein BpHYR1_030845 [Brachionus plicatilis]